MKTELIVVGKTTDSKLEALISDYMERIKHYIPFDITVLPELKGTKGLTFEQQKEREADLLLKSFRSGDCVVLLDEGGKEFRSIDFSKYIQYKLASPVRRLLFVIGGPYGFSESVYKAATEKLSLSKMTFSHQMIRLLFVEQVYRSMTILKGEPYHHE
ncbi:MAG: 23S rRNA (pseudouridine(1915)-N(3))-methyltransferase RlmH [Bacteroidaceae bacterium]